MKLKRLVVTLPFLLFGLQASEKIMRPFEQVNTLEVNTLNKVRFYAYKTLEEGINDLQENANTSAQEENYAFFPEQELWVELGYGEGFIQREGYKPQSILSLDEKYLDKLIKEYGPAEVYHFHPDKNLEKIGPIKQVSKKKQFTKKRKQAIKTIAEQLTYKKGSNPSTDDLTHLLYLKKKYPNTIGLCEFYVASSEHVAQYEVHEIVEKEHLFDNLEAKISGDTLGMGNSYMNIKVWPRTKAEEQINQLLGSQDSLNHYNYK